MSSDDSNVDFMDLEDDDEVLEVNDDEEGQENDQENDDNMIMELEDLVEASSPSTLQQPSSFSNLLDDDDDDDGSSSFTSKRKVSDFLDDDDEGDEMENSPSSSQEVDMDNTFNLPENIQRAADILDKGLGRAAARAMGQEDEEELDDDDFDALFEDSEEQERRRRIEALKKLDKVQKTQEHKIKKQKSTQAQKTKPKVPKTPQKPAAKKRKSAASSGDPSIFPNANDMVGLMAYIHSSGYNIICNGAHGGELSEKNREQVSEEIYALANLFGKRLNTVRDAFIETMKRGIVERGKARDQESAKLLALITAIQKYRRMITPLGEDVKPKTRSPWTGAEINGDDAHSRCTRIVIMPDEEDSKPLVFYEVEEVANLYRIIHTMCHFGAYLRVDLERIISKAKKTVDDAEDPDVIWEAVFDQSGNIPTKRGDQQDGTRLITLKQTLLSEMCKTLRKFSEELGAAEDPFKCN